MSPLRIRYAVKLCISLLVCIIVCVAAFSCASNVNSGTEKNPITPDELSMQVFKRLYRQADSVLLAYIQRVQDDSVATYALKTESVLAGELRTGTQINATSNVELAANTTYFVFLNHNGSNYTVLNDGAFKVVGNSVFVNRKHVMYDAVIAALNQYSSIITVPSATYFYTDIKDLAAASDEIFVGKLVSVYNESVPVKSFSDAAILERVADCRFASVRVFGSIKGKLRRNSVIKLLYIEDALNNMTDALTLNELSFESKYVLQLDEGESFIFFLENSPDAKQDYYFAVNPLQGWVHVDRDYVTVARHNTTLYGYGRFSSIVREIQLGLSANRTAD